MGSLSDYKEKQLAKILEEQKDNITGLADIAGYKNPSLLFYVLADKLGYLLDNNPEACISEKGLELRKNVSKLIRFFGPAFLGNPQVFENRNTLINPSDKTPDKGIELPKEPVIWVSNHGFKDDVLASVLTCKRNAYILFGSLPQFYNTIDGILAWANGVCMSNRKISASRKASVNKSLKVLSSGTDILLFPEGVWNKTPNELLLPFWPGVYHLSKEAHAKVVPMVHFLDDPFSRSKKNKIHTVIDEPIALYEYDEKEAISKLRDVMATWYYLLIEKYATKESREELLNGHKNSSAAWDAYLDKLTHIPKRYDPEIELCADYRSKNITRPEEVFEPIASLEPKKENIGHIQEATKIYVKSKRNDYQRRF